MAKFAWLSSIWKSASAEQPTFSDVGQLRAFIVEALRTHYERVESVSLDENDPAKFLARIDGHEISGDVTNLFGYIMSYRDEDAKGLIDKYIRMFAFTLEVTEENVVFVLRTRDYLDHVNQQIGGAVSEPLVE